MKDYFFKLFENVFNSFLQKSLNILNIKDIIYIAFSIRKIFPFYLNNRNNKEIIKLERTLKDKFSKFLLISEFKSEQQTKIRIFQTQLEDKKDIFKRKMEIVNLQDNNIIISLIFILREKDLEDIIKKIEIFFGGD